MLDALTMVASDGITMQFEIYAQAVMVVEVITRLIKRVNFEKRLQAGEIPCAFPMLG
jgi:hypothetical protein